MVRKKEESEQGKKHKGQSRQPTNHHENVNEKRVDKKKKKKRGDETQAAHTNYCNKQIYIKAA